MSGARLAPEVEFLIDFNVYQVPAIVGMEMPSSVAAPMVGTTALRFDAYVADVDARVEARARARLGDDRVRAAMDALDVPAGGSIMAVGDSITTYRHGYARVLEKMVTLSRPTDGIRFLNVAQSGYTSSDVLENTYTQFLAEDADVVLIKLGVNDCKRFGGTGAGTLISAQEYRANMAAIVEAFLTHTRARPILLTPIPVVERIANGNPDFAAMRMRWDNGDIAEAAETVRGLAAAHRLTVVDLVAAFGMRPRADLFLPDGLHPNEAGHDLIIDALAAAIVTWP